MSHFNNRSQSSARRSDYIWQYEYYDDEEPVSFEGLKAHRYSIVIGFWVGLAVFVIFMFFVLALLTKTGAPHQENPESTEKHHQTGSCLVDIGAPQDESDKAFSPSYFHFYINETRDVGKKKPEENGFGKQNKGPLQGIYVHQRGVSASGTDEAGDVIEEAGRDRPLNGLECKGDQDRTFFSQFDIPNFVNTSTLGEEDLLFEPSVIQAHQSHSWDGHCDIH